MDTSKLKKTDSKYISWGLALLGCSLIFLAIELKYPFFFLRDDNADSYISVYVYAIRCLSEGKFPFFCFNTMGGERFFATGQTGIFNPLIYFSYTLSTLLCGHPDMMIEIIVYLSILIGCTGAFFLLKRLGCSDLSAIIGSIAWNFNCYNIWEGSSWLVVIFTTSVFPFFLLTSLLVFEKKNILSLVLAVIPRVYLVYLGHPQFFIFAALFDCIFIGVFCLLKTKNGKLHSLLILIKDYVIIYISTTFLSLPLLIPEYLFTQLTYGYSAAKQYDNLLVEMWYELPAFFVPYLYTEESCSFFFPPFVGYLLTAMFAIGFFLLIFLFTQKSLAGFKSHRTVMIAVLPCVVLSYLLLFSYESIRVLALIPILNRFQYLHRICVFFSAFEVIFACVSMSIVEALCKKRFKTRDSISSFVKYAVIVLELMGFSFLFTYVPHLGRGPYFDTSRLYDYDFAEQFNTGRYVTAGFEVNDLTFNMKKVNLSENLDYNLAKYYGINNVSGYYYYLNNYDVLNYNECFYHMFGIKGSMFEYYPSMIEQMREQSVCWYIIGIDRRDQYEPHFKNYGLQFVKETEYSVIYYDPYAQPFAYDINKNEVNLVQDVNSLYLKTDSSFPGGKVTLNYAYDPNLVCYVDGVPTLITNEQRNWQFHIECSPGEHEIVVRYEDHIFETCCIITGEFIVLAGLAIFLKSQKDKKRKDAAATA